MKTIHRVVNVLCRNLRFSATVTPASIVTVMALALVEAPVDTLSAEPSLATAPPVVVKTEPVAGADDVDPALTEIKVTFSKTMRDGSWSWSTWGEENFPEMVGRPKYLADGRTCVLTVKLQPGKFYATWLNSEKFHNFKDTSGQPAVPYLLTFCTASAGAAVVERTIDQLVSAFPETRDLSTPESACAAWQRASAAKDATVISQLSLVPLDAQEQEKWYQRQAQHDPEGLAVYLKALADAKVMVVQVYRDELANVITYLPFPEGKGRSPYGARSFGLVNREWKNLGEDRLPNLESARANFVAKKERLWEQYVALKTKPSATAVSRGPDDDDWRAKLNENQRLFAAWTDRRFRSFFDERTFAGWSAKERSELEVRMMDTLNGPQIRDYYQAINTLGALRSTKALPVLQHIAFERVDKDNRDRWMAVRALGIIGDKGAVPEMIPLVYHGNVNTRWWAQISLVRLTGQNFGSDWQAWGDWWNKQGGQPAYSPEVVRWWNGQAEADQLAASLADGDRKFFAEVKSSGD